MATGVKPTAAPYVQLLALMAARGELGRAEAVLAGAEAEHRLAVEERLYNALVRGCCAAGALAAAEGVLQRMHNDCLNMELVARRGYRVQPSAVTYGLIIWEHCRRGGMADAQRLLASMRWNRIAPSTQIFNMLIHGFGVADNPRAAEDVLREMEGSGSWDMDALGVEPDVASFGTLIEAFATRGDVAQASRLFARMTRYHRLRPDEGCFISLVKAHARSGDPLAAEAVLGEAAAAGVEPGRALWTSVVATWAAAGDMGQAMRVFGAMTASGVRPSARVYHTLIWGFGLVSEPGRAADMLRLMVADGARPTVAYPRCRAARRCALPPSLV